MSVSSHARMAIEDKNAPRQLIYFFLFLIAYTALFFFALGKSNNYFLYMNGGYMWSPTLAALSALAVTRSGFRDLLLDWGPFRLLALSAVIPLLYFFAAYALMWAIGAAWFNADPLHDGVKKMGMSSWPMAIAAPIYLIMRSFFGTLSNMPSSFGEELGWRGFLMPRLRSRLSFTATALVVGTVWGAWHYPLIIKNSDPASPEPLAVKIACFTAMTIGLSFIFNWMTERSRSVWPAVVLHSAHNLFLGQFEGLTKSKENTDWYAGETGILLPFFTLLFAAFFWARRREVEGERAPSAAPADDPLRRRA